jgi:hypothetical protein
MKSSPSTHNQVVVLDMMGPQSSKRLGYDEHSVLNFFVIIFQGAPQIHYNDVDYNEQDDLSG